MNRLVSSLSLSFATAAGIFAQGTTVVVGGPPSPEPSEPVNILFINIDDMNDWTQMIGTNPQIQTPQMERLADMGTYFTDAHTNYPRCVQARSSYMSGLYPSTFWGKGVDGAVDGHEIKDAQGVIDQAALLGTRTLEGYFKDHGYKIYMKGKIYHDSKGPLADVWEHGGGGGAGKPANAADPPVHGTGTNWGVYTEEEATDENMGDYKKATWAVEMMNNHPADGEPFFIAVGFNNPHVPWFITKKWADLYPADETLWLEPFDPALWEVKGPHNNEKLGNEYGPSDLNKIPSEGARKLPQGYPNILDPDDRQYVGEQGRRDITQAYAACISFIDDQIGRILDGLADSPHADNTVIVVFSDHGYHLGSKNVFTKHNLWDRSTQVPLFFAGPGVPAGQMIDKSVELVDVYPTLLSLTHLPANPANEGDDLVPLMRDPSMDWDESAHAFHGNKDDQAVIRGDWRYIRYSPDDAQQELYNITADPYEQNNLAFDPEYETERATMDALLLPTP